MQPSPTYEQILQRVGSEPVGDRDSWFNETAGLFDGYSFCLTAERITERKDGYRMLVLVLAPPEKVGERITVSDGLDIAIRNHVGLAFFKLDGTHIWSLSHGEMLAWRLFREPYPKHLQTSKGISTNRSTLSPGETIFATTPNLKLLPPLVRNSVRWFMKEKLKMRQPKVAAIATSRDPKNYRLLFNFGPATLGSEAAASEAFQQVHWYIPRGTPTFFMPKLENAKFLMPI